MTTKYNRIAPSFNSTLNVNFYPSDGLTAEFRSNVLTMSVKLPPYSEMVLSPTLKSFVSTQKSLWRLLVGGKGCVVFRRKDLILPYAQKKFGDEDGGDEVAFEYVPTVEGSGSVTFYSPLSLGPEVYFEFVVTYKDCRKAFQAMYRKIYECYPEESDPEPCAFSASTLNASALNALARSFVKIEEPIETPLDDLLKMLSEEAQKGNFVYRPTHALFISKATEQTMMSMGFQLEFHPCAPHIIHISWE